MKRILSIILLCVTSLCAFSQEDVTLFFLNDGTFKGFYDEEIDSITYSHLDLDSIYLSAKNFQLVGDSIHTAIEMLKAKEMSGIEIKTLQSDVIVSQSGVRLTDLQMETNNSLIHADLNMLYSGYEDFLSFVDSVYFDATVYPTGADLMVLPYQGTSDLLTPAAAVIDRLKPRAVLLDHWDDAFPPVSSAVDTSDIHSALEGRLRMYCLEPGGCVEP